VAPRQQSRRKAAADACPRPRSEVREESAQHGAVVRVQMAVVPSAAPCAVQQRIARVFVVFASTSAAAAAVRCPPQSKHLRSSVAPHASPRRRRRCTGGCLRGVASVARRTTPPASPPATGRRSEGVKVQLPPLSSADTRSARAAVLRCVAKVPRSKAQLPKLLFPPPSCAAGSTPPRRTACMPPGAPRAEKAAPYRLTCRYACTRVPPLSRGRPYGAMAAEESGETVTGTVSWFSVIKGYGARRAGPKPWPGKVRRSGAQLTPRAQASSRAPTAAAMFSCIRCACRGRGGVAAGKRATSVGRPAAVL